LAREDEHLVLGDFNLHHPLWSSYRNPATYFAADIIVEALSAGNIKLVTPRGITIWETRDLINTIDLAFTS